MFRRFHVVSIIPVLAGCAFPQANPIYAPASPAPVQIVEGRLDFDWQLSGDRAVAPLQAFSDAAHTWLQFPPNRPLPAIFQVVGGREQPVSYRRQSPYIILDGVGPEFTLRGGALSARVVYRGAAPAADERAPWPAMPDVARGPGNALPRHDGEGPSHHPDAGHAAGGEALPMRDAGTPAAASRLVYRAMPQDVNMRGVLARWARDAGWTFDAEHWALDADIPLAGTAQLGEDFKPAVSRLLETTELGDRPAHPCFYSNRVLRVVPQGQACDRAARTEMGAA